MDISSKFIEEMALKPLSIREMSERLDLKKSERAKLKRYVKEMVADGRLIKIRGGRYGLPSSMKLVRGEFICHPNGFGFVKPDSEGEDIFINPRNINGAIHGDLVLVRVERFKGNRKREGRVIRVVERRHKRIVGRFEDEKGFGIVTPSDERILQNIIIPSGSTKGAKAGEIVEVEITRWAAGRLASSGRVIGILGSYNDPDVEIEVIVKKYGLPYRFPSEVIAEAERIPQSVAESEMRGRKDLRGRRTITIDGENAKDFDDAVSIEKKDDGYKLWVSIADVSHYIMEGSLLDLEAYKRGTSVYFPDRCVPMFPEPLSNGICSLNPSVDRLAFTVEIDFKSNGIPIKRRLYESVINSHKRLTYTTVSKLLSDNGMKPGEAGSGIMNDLLIMKELSLKLNERRNFFGSLDFDLPEPQIIIDIEGKIEDIVRAERNIAHQIIEEFMLAANKAVATYMKRLPFLYRVHDEPDDENVQDLLEFVHNLGYRLKSKVKGHSLFKDILEKARGRPEERLVNHILLRAMKQARYSEKNTGHFGLAFDCYTHFTSPIRRYPDLTVHRLLKRMIKKNYTVKEKERWDGILPKIAAHTSKRERVAMEAEREVVELKKAQFMQNKVGKRFTGLISGVTSFGLFVELDEYFVEGLVHISSLVDDYYLFMEKEHALLGKHTKKRYIIGDRVKVKIVGVDLEKKEISMNLVDSNSTVRKKPARIINSNKRGRRISN